MKNKEKLIRIYNKALESGRLEKDGLCNTLFHNNINPTNLELFKPTIYSLGYWAGNNVRIPMSYYYKFNPLRQTILAFLIAMEDD